MPPPPATHWRVLAVGPQRSLKDYVVIGGIIIELFGCYIVYFILVTKMTNLRLIRLDVQIKQRTIRNSLGRQPVQENEHIFPKNSIEHCSFPNSQFHLNNLVIIS